MIIKKVLCEKKQKPRGLIPLQVSVFFFVLNHSKRQLGSVNIQDDVCAPRSRSESRKSGKKGHILVSYEWFPNGHYRLFYLHLSGCWLVVRLRGPNRETITREIISSVFSSYPPCPVTSPLLACLWICLPALIFYTLCFFGPVVSSTLFGFLTVKREKCTETVFHVCWVCD